MLDPASWLEAAKATPEGKSRRLDHDCGDGRTLVVDHKETGWGAWCHRCNDRGWEPRPKEGLTQRLARLNAIREVESAAAQTVRPPAPANFDPSSWPLKHRVWLYKAGLSNPMIKASGFYYNERLDRVVLPVFENGKVVYWQARTQDPDLPKYLNPEDGKVPFKWGNFKSGPLVLTEDILSARKVGEVTEAWCLMGTSISSRVATQLLRLKKPVIVWLDPDGAGVKARSKFVPVLRSYGISAKGLTTGKDPKYYSIEEIRHQLGIDGTAASSDARAL